MKMRLTAASLLLFAGLSSCGTSHTARWVYGASSTFEEPSPHSEENALRAAIGLPVIVGGVAFDVVTFPVQIMFGVWPWWGDASLHMKPDQQD
ncbi:MAG: hypothetical protein ACE37K_08640 [Planctomycetota bacterium]|jgi:hypothetical protein